MKKQLLVIISLCLSTLLSACSMQGQKLHADSDDQQDNHLPSEVTDWNHLKSEMIQKAAAAGYGQQAIGKTVQILEEKINEGESEDWAEVYALNIMQGKSQKKAEIAANNREHTNTYQKAYKKAIGKGKKFAEKYANVYQIQIQAGRDEKWANSYAAMIAQGKTKVYAHFFARKVIEGKSNSWANAYANAMELSDSSTFSTKVADIYTMKIKQGMKKRAAQEAALRIANKGSQEDEKDINSQDENGDTDLIKAAREGDLVWVTKLLELKANCNVINNEGKTALIVAIEQGSKSMLYIVGLLLDADPKSRHIADYNGTTAISWARRAKGKISKKDKRKKEKRQQYNSIIRILKKLETDENGARRIIQEYLPVIKGLIPGVGML